MFFVIGLPSLKMLKLLPVAGLDCNAVSTLSRAVTRQYHVPVGSTCVQVVPACHGEL